MGLPVPGQYDVQPDYGWVAFKLQLHLKKKTKIYPFSELKASVLSWLLLTKEDSEEF